MSKPCVAFCRALGLKQIHVVGFSLGGMIAQQLALEHPQLVGRLILLGTGPRGGEDMTFITELSPEEQAGSRSVLVGCVLLSSGNQPVCWTRIREATPESRKKLIVIFLQVSRDAAVAHELPRSGSGERYQPPDVTPL